MSLSPILPTVTHVQKSLIHISMCVCFSIFQVLQRFKTYTYYYQFLYRLDNPLTWGILPARTYLYSHLTRWTRRVRHHVTDPSLPRCRCLPRPTGPRSQSYWYTIRVFLVLFSKGTGNRDVSRWGYISICCRSNHREAACWRVGTCCVHFVSLSRAM